jgi:hypothetical protein
MRARPDALVVVKSLHTVIWALFVAGILAIPILVFADRPRLALVLIGIVAIEVLIIVFNGWRCPLTDVAARYTADGRDNFDIYLPLWLARYNKAIFGMLFFAGVLFTAARLLR